MGGWLRAYIRASDTFERECASLQSSLLVAIAKDRNLLAPLLEKLREWQKQAYGCGVDAVVVAVILLTLDGLTMNGLFGFDALEEGMNAQAIAYLLNLTRTTA
ncbi:MAG: hypothetical protein HC918_00520 [Oscillatoriales cyanobacterium SM2_1_8]|nr:hypothetical protein [Oscillatoriales cyanobacterium SM2_1_8]